MKLNLLIQHFIIFYPFQNKKVKFVLERAEKIVGIGENASYQHFLLFLQCFRKDYFLRSFKVGIVW